MFGFLSVEMVRKHLSSLLSESDREKLCHRGGWHGRAKNVVVRMNFVRDVLCHLVYEMNLRVGCALQTLRDPLTVVG